jgi:hypothetical protein
MRKIFLSSLSLLTVLLLGACNLVPASVKANPLTGPEQTQLAQTVAALEATATPTITPTPSSTPTSTIPAPPTSTLAPSVSPTEAPTQTPLPTYIPVPCDIAGFVGDVTIPDGTVLDPGESFTKIWRLRNDGTCTWTTAYQLIFTGGSLMSGPTVVQLPYDVAPGNTVDLSVGLVAPLDYGTYQGYWMLRDPNGAVFGLHPDGAHPFWVEIVVGSSSSAFFAVTHAAASADPTSYSGVCPVTITFSADIQTSAGGTVNYHWQRSDGSKSPVETITFSDAGSQTVSESWTVGTPGQVYNGWDQVYIDEPNHQLFEPATFSIACNSPTPTQTQAPTLTPTPKPTFTPTPKPTFTPTPTQPAPTQTPQPTMTSTPTQPSPTQTSTPTLPPTATPTATSPAPTATTQPTLTPTPTQPAPTKTN